MDDVGGSNVEGDKTCKERNPTSHLTIGSCIRFWHCQYLLLVLSFIISLKRPNLRKKIYSRTGHKLIYNQGVSKNYVYRPERLMRFAMWFCVPASSIVAREATLPYCEPITSQSFWEKKEDINCSFTAQTIPTIFLLLGKTHQCTSECFVFPTEEETFVSVMIPVRRACCENYKVL